MLPGNIIWRRTPVKSSTSRRRSRSNAPGALGELGVPHRVGGDLGVVGGDELAGSASSSRSNAAHEVTHDRAELLLPHVHGRVLVAVGVEDRARRTARAPGQHGAVVVVIAFLLDLVSLAGARRPAPAATAIGLGRDEAEHLGVEGRWRARRRAARRVRSRHHVGEVVEHVFGREIGVDASRALGEQRATDAAAAGHQQLAVDGASVAAPAGDERRHQLGSHRREEPAAELRLGEVLGHPGGRGRLDGVDADAVRRAFGRQARGSDRSTLALAVE